MGHSLLTFRSIWPADRHHIPTVPCSAIGSWRLALGHWESGSQGVQAIQFACVGGRKLHARPEDVSGKLCWQPMATFTDLRCNGRRLPPKRQSNLRCPVAMWKKGILFWLVDFKGEPFRKKKKKKTNTTTGQKSTTGQLGDSLLHLAIRRGII